MQAFVLLKPAHSTPRLVQDKAYSRDVLMRGRLKVELRDENGDKKSSESSPSLQHDNFVSFLSHTI